MEHFSILYALTGSLLRKQFWKAFVPLFAVHLLLINVLINKFANPPLDLTNAAAIDALRSRLSQRSRGGDSGTFVLVTPHTSWTDFEDKPDMKPFPAMLTEALGADEGKLVLKEIDASVEKTTSEVTRFRDDLSYLPAN